MYPTNAPLPPPPPSRPPAHRARHAAGRQSRQNGGDGYDGDRSRRRVPGWVLPLALVLGGAAAILGALALNGDDTAAALGAPAPVTPVLSARRAPEMTAAPVADRRLSADLEAWVAQSPPNTCLVVRGNGNDNLYAHNPTVPLAAASNQKLVTASALLLLKGPDGHMDTVLGGAAPAAGGVVAGDLYVVGGGDPLWATGPYAATLNRNHGARLAVDPAALADAVVAAGITRIEGSVVGDDSRYDAQRYHPAWRTALHDDVGPVSALNINDGHAQQADGSTGPASNDPAANAAAILTDLLRQRGVMVAGEAHSGTAPAGLDAVATVPSASVRDIVAEMLTDSDNDTAEMAFKEIGHEQGGAGTWDAGVTAETGLLSQAGVPMDGVSIVDGSGLSDQNRVTCQMLNDVLSRPDTGPALVDGLAVAGQSGTLTDRWNGSPVAGHLRAKTGTLRNVTALSGRVEPLQGGTLTFAYVANAPESQQITNEQLALQTTLGEILVNYPRGVDINALLPAPSG